MASFLAVPHIPQRLEFTCGPAVARMVLAYHGISVGSVRAWWQTHANQRTGTSRHNLTQMLRSYGLRVHAHHDGTLTEIRNWLTQRVPVIVLYREPLDNEGHYAVVIGCTAQSVVLCDPYHGPQFRLSQATFRRRWLGSRASHPRWMLAATDVVRSRPSGCPRR